jgi:hypothetical protein
MLEGPAAERALWDRLLAASRRRSERFLAIV